MGGVKRDFLSNQQTNMKKMLENSSVALTAKRERIPLPTKEGYIFISPEDIIRCGVNKKVSVCVLKSNVHQELLLSLKQTEEILKKYGFFRVHHAHLININHVEKYIKEGNSGGTITMSSGEIVGISKRKKSNFINYLKTA
jgi:two-component system LytT family response regulator